jgi:hypothetical protein
MDQAISSLVGVVVGGAVTYAGQRGLDGRREGREGEWEQRAENRATDAEGLTTTAAARLVFLDVFSVFTFLRSSRDSKRWWIEVLLKTDAWDRHREQLCRALSGDVFRQVGSTFAGIEAWDITRRAASRYHWVRPHLKLRGTDGLAGMRDTLIEASAQSLLLLSDLGMGTLRSDHPLLATFRAEARNVEGPS